MDDARKKEIRQFLRSFDLTLGDEHLDLVHLSLIHRSWTVEHNAPGDNERLEFLGDAVIGLATTEYLYEHLPKEDEGHLSKLRATMVSRKVLGEIALGMHIGHYLLLGVGEEANGGRSRLTTLGSALEAFSGALYLIMPWTELKQFIERVIINPSLALAKRRVMIDYKSKFQEWSQQDSQELPEYRLIKEEGPDHAKVFWVELWLGNELLGTGKGSRKKLAENDAARAALETVR
jgi:ribonuclease III